MLGEFSSAVLKTLHSHCAARWPCRAVPLVTRAAALSLLALGFAGCSTPDANPSSSNHSYEVAVAWAAGATTDGFYFPISCPGPEKLVLFGQARFEMSCDHLEKIRSKMVDVAPDEPGGQEPAAPGRTRQLDCALVVVPDFKAVPGVLTDLRRGIAAKRAGPLDCALVRYD